MLAGLKVFSIVDCTEVKEEGIGPGAELTPIVPCPWNRWIGDPADSGVASPFVGGAVLPALPVVTSVVTTALPVICPSWLTVGRPGFIGPVVGCIPGIPGGIPGRPFDGDPDGKVPTPGDILFIIVGLSKPADTFGELCSEFSSSSSLKINIIYLAGIQNRVFLIKFKFRIECEFRIGIHEM